MLLPTSRHHCHPLPPSPTATVTHCHRHPLNLHPPTVTHHHCHLHPPSPTPTVTITYCHHHPLCRKGNLGTWKPNALLKVKEPLNCCSHMGSVFPRCCPGPKGLHWNTSWLHGTPHTWVPLRQAVTAQHELSTRESGSRRANLVNRAHARKGPVGCCEVSLSPSVTGKGTKHKESKAAPFVTSPQAPQLNSSSQGFGAKGKHTQGALGVTGWGPWF